MREICRFGPAVLLVSLIALLSVSLPQVALAEDKASVAVHIADAEQAVKRRDYRVAAERYRQAAELSDSVEVARKATRLAFAYRFNDEALLAAKRWVKLDKDSEEARTFLGQIYFRLDDVRNSRRQFERVIKKGSAEPGERILGLVGYLSEEGEPKRADALIRALAKPYKKSSLAHYAAAITALQAGDSEQAKQRVQRALELDPDNIKPKLLYARALMFEEQPDEAINYLAHIIGDSSHPDPDARMELALMYMMTDRDDDALSQVNQVLMEQAGRIDALRLMAIINFRLERLDAAWDDFQDLLGTGQYRMDALYYLARIADYRDEHDRAVRLYREVRYGSNTLISQRRASALLAHELDKTDDAFDLLDRFGESSPNHSVDMVIAKAQLMVSLGRYDEGLELYNKAVQFRPDNEGMILGRGELLLRTGRLDEAIASYREAVKRWPESSLSLNALGYTLADRTENYAEAERYIRDALELDPENPAIIDSLGWVLYKLGQPEAALVELRRAYAGFSDQEVAAHIVEVLAVLERREEALEMLEQAEKKDPESEMLADVRARFFKTDEE